jgi:hypothetical protein
MSPHSDTHYLDSESTSLCSLSLMLHAQRRSNTYQFYSLWFDPMAMETQDLQHQRRWKPRIYSTRGDRSPGSTALEVMGTRDLQHQRRWKRRIYSIRGDGNAGSTASEASTLAIKPPMAKETQDLQHQRRAL